MAEEVVPTIGHALSFTVTLIVLKGFAPGKTAIQNVAVTGEKKPFWLKVAPGKSWLILELTKTEFNVILTSIVLTFMGLLYYFESIKTDFPDSPEAKNIDVFIGKAQAAIN